jgi:4-amino-4-deoxychorismate lyase
MSPLIESIKLENGRLANLNYHNRRMEDVLKNYFGINRRIDLGQVISIPADKKVGLYRCRITYAPEIIKTEFIPHTFREISSLKVIESNDIEYGYKFSDRSGLETLFARRGDCDDILIVKNGNITDSFTANPVFFDGQQWWATDTPLLAGTQRARLLDEHKIGQCRITPADLWKYSKVGLINIFWDLENMPVIDIGAIY